MSVSFFKPMHFEEQSTKNHLFNFVEDYFNYGNRTFSVFKTHTKNDGYLQDTLYLSETTKKQHLGYLILKIISLATVLFPLVMLICKAVCRNSLKAYQFKYCTENRLAGERLLGQGIKETETEIRKKANQYTGSDLANYLTQSYPHLSFEIGTHDEIDQKMDRLVYMNNIIGEKKLSQLSLPPAKMVDISVVGKERYLLVSKKVDEVDASQKDAEFDTLVSKGALKEIVTLIKEARLADFTYADLGITKEGQFVVKNTERMPLLTTHGARETDKRDALNFLHEFLISMPNKHQRAAIDFGGFRTEEVFNSMKPESATALYRMLTVANKIFADNGITYWASSGTLLGVARNHKGIIPWDDDIDIIAFNKDRQKIKNLNTEFEKYGYHLYESFLGIKIADIKYKDTFPAYLDKKDEKMLEKLFPGVDIFLSEKDDKDGKYYFADAQARKWWPKEYWLENEIQKFKQVEFGPTTIMVPDADLSRHLKLIYGNDCYYVGYRIWDHANATYFKKERVYLTKFEPVKSNDFDDQGRRVDLSDL